MKTTGVLVINPGGTSTKAAILNREEFLLRENYEHEAGVIKSFDKVIDQYDYRREMLEELLAPHLKDIELLAVAGRGGPLKPLEGGTYAVNEAMMDNLRSIKYSDHASNLGALLADYFAGKYGVKAYVVDPVTVDNFSPLARLSGLPGIERKSRSHALNIKATARVAAERIGKKVNEANFIVIHLGSGFSICALEKGKIVDVNDALHGMGPFSVNRAGALPIGGLVKMCYSGEYSQEQMLKKLAAESGLQAYIGTSDFKIALQRMAEGEKEVEQAVEAMIYQIAKEAGACSAVLKGRIDGIVITGGLAFADYVVDKLTDYLGYLGEIIHVPGEFEMEALARGVYRVIDGIEEAKIYV